MERNIKIVICTERGLLEKYSILLCRSLREFGGDMANTDVYSIAPRKGYYPSKNTISELEKLSVKHLNTDLNIKYRNYPLANKPFVCEYFENEFPNSTIVFIDSDQLIFNCPSSFSLESQTDLLIRQVDMKGIGFYDKYDPEYEYWSSVFSLLNINIDEGCFFETSSGEKIYPYFNSGLIVVQSDKGLFKRWRENFEKVSENKLFPKGGLFFLEQSIFSATVLQMDLKYKLLDNLYNYPFSLHDSIDHKFKVDDLSNIVTAHYHDLLVTKTFPEFFSDFLNKNQKGIWLEQQIINLGIKPDTLWQKYFKKVKNKLSKKYF